MSRLIDVLLVSLLLAATPVWLPAVLAKRKWRLTFLGRFGACPRRPRVGARPCVWLHAVSVGEVRAAEPIVRALREVAPGVDVAISTTTLTGQQTARELFPGALRFQTPHDLAFAYRRVIRRLRPAALVTMELELWPQMARVCAEERLPLIVVNGRMTARSAAGYRRFGWLIGGMFRRVTAVLAQTPRFAERFVGVGVPAARVEVTGSVKYDALPIDDADLPQLRADARAALHLAPGGAPGSGPVVWVAGSTHPPEHEAVIRTWQALRRDGIDLRLVLVPRHPDKPDPVRFLVEQGVPFVRDSDNSRGLWHGDHVRLGDQIGTLIRAYAAADVAFVGKSLYAEPSGGQNPLEPAALGVPTVFGRYMANFEGAVDDLLRRDGAVRVADEAELAEAIRSLALDPARRATLRANARAAVTAGRGASARTAARLLEHAGLATKPGVAC